MHRRSAIGDRFCLMLFAAFCCCLLLFAAFCCFFLLMCCFLLLFCCFLLLLVLLFAAFCCLFGCLFWSVLVWLSRVPFCCLFGVRVLQAFVQKHCVFTNKNGLRQNSTTLGWSVGAERLPPQTPPILLILRINENCPRGARNKRSA